MNARTLAAVLLCLVFTVALVAVGLDLRRHDRPRTCFDTDNLTTVSC